MFDHVHGTQDDMLPRIKDGRTFWYRKTLFFTKDEFADDYTGSYWRKVTKLIVSTITVLPSRFQRLLMNGKQNYLKVFLPLLEVMMLIILSV